MTHEQKCDSTEVDGNTSVNLNKGRTRAWVFTAYEQDYKTLDTYLRGANFSYWVYQYEVCPKTQREHRQGAFRLTHPISFSALQKHLPGIHLEPTRSESHAFKYCCKEETRKPRTETVMFGSPPKQGKRSDLVQLAKDVVDGKSIEEIARRHPGGYIRYNKGILALQHAISPFRQAKPIIRWYYGSAGSGKTLAAVGLEKDYYIKDGTPWWDGYVVGQHIIIDDFDGKWPYRDLLRLLDRYKYQGQVKGGYVKINSNITITCEFHPRHFWMNNALEQVLRRLDIIKNFDYSQSDIDNVMNGTPPSGGAPPAEGSSAGAPPPSGGQDWKD